MQKKRKRSFRKKIKLPLHKTPEQRFRMELRRREKTRAKSREKIAKIKMQYKTKAVKQKGRQKEKAAGRIDRMLSAVAFLLGAGIWFWMGSWKAGNGILKRRRKRPVHAARKIKCKNMVYNIQVTEHRNQNTSITVSK